MTPRGQCVRAAVRYRAREKKQRRRVIERGPVFRAFRVCPPGRLCALNKRYAPPPLFLSAARFYSRRFHELKILRGPRAFIARQPPSPRTRASAFSAFRTFLSRDNVCAARAFEKMLMIWRHVLG